MHAVPSKGESPESFQFFAIFFIKNSIDSESFDVTPPSPNEADLIDHIFLTKHEEKGRDFKQNSK